MTAECPGAGPCPYLSELPDVTSRVLHDCVHVKAVGPASRGCICCQPPCSPFEQSVRPSLIASGSVCDGNADLRKSLPQVPFLFRPGLPTRLEDLVGGEGTADVHERSSCQEGLFRRQRLLRHRLDPFGAIGQRPAQRVARPCLAGTSFGVPVTIRTLHATSLPRNEAICRSPQVRLSGACDSLPSSRATIQKQSQSSKPEGVVLDDQGRPGPPGLHRLRLPAARPSPTPRRAQARRWRPPAPCHEEWCPQSLKRPRDRRLHRSRLGYGGRHRVPRR
jgi:hypothetical protein